jgi:hypothetical protein
VTERFVVQVDADQFDRLARPTQPLAGIAELIWNALDAEAEAVIVAIDRSDMDGVDVATVIDDGHGMTHDETSRDFRKLGGSWKKKSATSKNGKRPLHGKEGSGRFRAFAVGSTVEWSSISKDVTGKLQRTVVTGSMYSSEFTVSDPAELATGSTGTVVRITEPREHANRILGDEAPTWLVTRFAVYLVNYPTLNISFDGRSLDPAAILESQTEIELEASLGGEHGRPILRILEWKPTVTTIAPSLMLCDGDGVALHEVTDGIDRGVGVRFTAYLIWPGFTEHANELLLGDLGHPVLGPVIEAAREAIREFLDARLSERRAEQIERWKKDRVYPYTEPPKTPVEVQEREVFDVVAATAASAVAKEPKAAKLSLRLIKEALAQPPGALHRVLKEVLDLTPAQLADFDLLLDRTTLASIIYTSKIVVDRLDFVQDLEGLLFDHGKKEKLLERTQLHRILANGRTWVFGEQYTLAVDDLGLTKVLEAHNALLGIDEPVVAPVMDTEGHTRLVDLLLSKAALFSDRREHLVIELKRPSVTLSQTELSQITNYAVAVSSDARFKADNVAWEFWLVGDDMDEVVEQLVNKTGQPAGLYTEHGSYRIWVRRWADLLEENRQRLHFYRDHLQYQPKEEAELEEVLGKYLPRTTPQESPPAAASSR